jgi:menaquinone-dependent protoporphyrinogen IX oxidase
MHGIQLTWWYSTRNRGTRLVANLRTLVVYYSRSGTTRKIAEALSRALNANVEEIVESKSRAGFFGYLRSLVEAIQRNPSAIAQSKCDPSSYDRVIIGTPVWAWSVSSPVRAYLMANKGHLPEVAFYCTLGGRGSDSVFRQMQSLAGKAPRAVYAVTAGEVISTRYGASLAAFAKALEPSASAA